MGAPTPIFILSFRQRDELARLTASAGWQAIAARRADDVERRFLASGAIVAVVDGRGDLAEGLRAAERLGAIVESSGGAMLALVSHGDIAALPRFYDAGATHFLASPATEAELLQALRFAWRHAERIGGDALPRRGGEILGWRYDPSDRTVELTPALAASAGTPRSALARLTRADRRNFHAALRRLNGEGLATAVAHDLTGMGRVVQHLQRGENGRIEAIVELLGRAPEAGTLLTDTLGEPRDGAAARRWLVQRLAAPGDIPMAVLLVELNRFEIVNASYGRAAGDELLEATRRRTVEAARQMLGRHAFVARIGGSSFLVAERATGERAALAADRIAAALARPFVIGGSLAMLGARVGIALAEPGDDAAILLRRAGEALADARDSDSTSVRMAEAGDTPVARLAVDLRRAMADDEIDVLFQPQVAIPTGAIVGVEALARWDHPDLGPISADLLFMAAARADAEIALSDHIQRLALASAARWPAALRSIRLAINLTAADIVRPGFADLFLDRVDSSGFPRTRLTVEITESGLIDDIGAAAQLLAALRSAGLRVAIDDFGTGYSSLAYLKALPLDYLKIDRRLTQDITGSARDRVVVRGVIDMARSLGLAVVAEGVETEEQLAALAADGCQLYQGFLRSEAVTSDMLVDLIA